MKTVDEIYQNIAMNIANTINEKWSKAILNIEIQENYVGDSGIYINDESQQKQLATDQFEWEYTDDILELHEITTQGGNNKWNKAIFTLEADRTFSMDFIWDQEYQDEVDSFS